MPDQPELRQRLEQVLIEHTFVQGDDKQPGGCTGATCTWHGWFLGDWRRHIADVLLALPGIAVTPVPKPESTTTDIDGDGLKTAQFPHDITAWGGEYPGVMDCDADMSIEVARSLAASLLGAANFAEFGVAEEYHA